MQDLTPPTRWAVPRPLLSVLVATLLFVALEAAIQWRSYLRTGQSIISRVQGESPYVHDAELGFNLLRPNHTYGGAQQKVASNSLGLRSPEIPEAKPSGTVRVAVLGASTVFGAYAPTNGHTFPARLQELLRERNAERQVDVINAGVVGLGIRQQELLFQRRISRSQPDITVVYPGFNDFAGYCRKATKGRPWVAQPLLSFGLPPWLLSVELLMKNTVPVRTLPAGLNPGIDVESLNLEPYRQRVRTLLATLQASGTQPLIARNARSYRPDQPLAEQQRLSVTARFYNPCFDIDGLHALYERHNGVISQVATELGVPVLAIDEAIPGGDRYFSDASHFSPEGERFVAAWLADRLEPMVRGLSVGTR